MSRARIIRAAIVGYYRRLGALPPPDLDELAEEIDNSLGVDKPGCCQNTDLAVRAARAELERDQAQEELRHARRLAARDELPTLFGRKPGYWIDLERFVRSIAGVGDDLPCGWPRKRAMELLKKEAA